MITTSNKFLVGFKVFSCFPIHLFLSGVNQPKHINPLTNQPKFKIGKDWPIVDGINLVYFGYFCHYDGPSLMANIYKRR